MSNRYEKKAEHTGWSDDIPEEPPAYQQYSAPRGLPPLAQNPFHQSSGRSDNKGYGDGVQAAPYYPPPPNHPSSSRSSPYPPGPSSYGRSNYGGPSQSQGPFQGRYQPPSDYSQGGSPYPEGVNQGQQFPGFTYTGKAPSKRDPLNPPPPSFTRPQDPQSPHPRLHEPIRIAAQDASTLSKGFVPVFPAPQLLMAHDVQPADLARLLEDCHLVSAESVGQRVAANVAPLVLGVGFLPGLFVTRAIEKRMKRGNVGDVVGLVEVWDQAFFAPRRLRITMQRGTGAGGAMMDGDGVDDDGSSSSSSSSSDSSGGRRRNRTYGRNAYDGRGQGSGYEGFSGALGRRANRRADKADRKADRRARKADKRASRRGGSGTIGNGSGRIYLVISDR